MPTQPVVKTVAVTKPSHLALYFGYPSLVNGALGDLDKAAAFFTKFDIVVFGDGIYVNSHPEHHLTIQLINKMKVLKPTVEIFGYIPIGDTKQMHEVLLKEAIDSWKTMGVTGIYADEFGYDFAKDMFGTDTAAMRRRQNMFVDYAHSLFLPVFVNSWDINDAMKDYQGVASKLGADDYCLLESFLLGHGLYSSLDVFSARVTAANNYHQSKGVKIAAVSTITPSEINSSSSSTPGFKFAWCGAAMCNFNAFQYTDMYYSATTNQLYYYPQFADAYGTEWKDESIKKISPTEYERRSNAGVM